MLSVCSGVGNKEETVVVEDIAAIARSALRSIADPHANGCLFVDGVTAPVWFPANAAKSVLSHSVKAILMIGSLR